jgi:hypothetical protein
VAVFDLDSREVRPLLDGTYARYANGHVFWVDGEGTLFAAAFDVNALELSGAGVELADAVQLSLQGSYDFAVSETGTLVYSTGPPRVPAAGRRSRGWTGEATCRSSIHGSRRSSGTWTTWPSPPTAGSSPSRSRETGMCRGRASRRRSGSTISSGASRRG